MQSAQNGRAQIISHPVFCRCANSHDKLIFEAKQRESVSKCSEMNCMGIRIANGDEKKTHFEMSFMTLPFTEI